MYAYKAMNMAMQVLTEDGEVEISGAQGGIAVVVLADKDGVVIGVVGDGVGELHGMFALCTVNLGPFLRTISAAKYDQGDVEVINWAILQID